MENKKTELDGQWIKIRDWSDYNPPLKAASRRYWFRFECDLFENQHFALKSSSHLLVFIYLLTLYTKSNATPIQLSCKFIATRLKLSSSRLVKILEYLLEIGYIEMTHGARGGTSTRQTRQDKTIYNAQSIKVAQTEKTENPASLRETKPLFNFDSIYQIYPRKTGKIKGLEKAKREIKTQSDFDSLLQAVSRFVEHHKKLGTEEKYIPYFQTFMNSWRDWTDPEIGKCEKFEKPISSNIDWDKIERESKQKEGKDDIRRV